MTVFFGWNLTFLTESEVVFLHLKTSRNNLCEKLSKSRFTKNKISLLHGTHPIAMRLCKIWPSICRISVIQSMIDVHIHVHSETSFQGAPVKTPEWDANEIYFMNRCMYTYDRSGPWMWVLQFKSWLKSYTMTFKPFTQEQKQNKKGSREKIRAYTDG